MLGFDGRIHQRASMRNMLFHIICATAAAKLTIGEERDAGATRVAGTAAILLPGVVGASPVDWTWPYRSSPMTQVVVSGAPKLSAVPQEW